MTFKTSNHWKLLLLLFPIIGTCVLASPGGQRGFFAAWYGAAFSEDIISTEGLFLRYTFDELLESDYTVDDGNTADKSTNNWAALIAGNTPIWGTKIYTTNGLYRIAQYNGYLSGIATSKYDTMTNLTWATWVYPSTIRSGDRILSSYDGAGAGVQGEHNLLFLNNPSGQLRARAAINVLGTQVNLFSTNASISNVWTHYAMTYDGNDFIFYVNSQIQASTNIGLGSITFTPSSSDNGIGLAEDSPVAGSNLESFLGYMDNVRIYTRALSQDEITTLFNEGHDTP